MFNKYLDDYYLFKNVVKEFVVIEDKVPSTFNRWLKRNGLKTRQGWLQSIDTGIPELDKVLSERYVSMLKRCNYKKDNRYLKYKSMAYMPVYKYVEFCHSNVENIKELWEVYLSNNKELKYALSLDRIDNNKGYIEGNIEIVPHGFNSWKRSVFPIRVEHEKETHYFMSREEGSLFYGLRRQTIGEIYSNERYHKGGYKVYESNVEDVLKHNRIETLFEYYKTLRR